MLGAKGVISRWPFEKISSNQPFEMIFDTVEHGVCINDDTANDQKWFISRFPETGLVQVNKPHRFAPLDGPPPKARCARIVTIICATHYTWWVRKMPHAENLLVAIQANHVRNGGSKSCRPPDTLWSPEMRGIEGGL